MSGTVWTKFFWSDWQSEPALRVCSYAARGLWMDMLCIAAAHDPIGYVAVAGRGLDETAIARMTGGTESEVRDLLGELDRNGVFSRDRHGRIYSRRMIADARRAAIARKNGKKGGNPSLGKNETISASDNPPDIQPLKPQEPEAISQSKNLDADASLSDPLDRTRPKPLVSKSEMLAIWSEAPKAARERSSQKDLTYALEAAVRRGGRIEDIRAALKAAYASRSYSGDHAKGIHRLVQNDRWQSFVEASPGPLLRTPTFPGPAEIRAAVVAAKDEDFAVAWLDRCGWRDLPERVVISANSFVVDTLRREVGSALSAQGVRVLLEKAA